MERLLKIEEVAILIGSSVQTINMWYRFKRSEPENEYAKMLPDYIQKGGLRSTRYWTQKDIYKLIEFKQSIPLGRNGVLGTITQKYVKRRRKNADA